MKFTNMARHIARPHPTRSSPSLDMRALWALAVLALAAAVKVKVVMHSEAEDSHGDEATLLPFVRRGRERTPTTPRPHPNDLLFPLIYRQAHVNANFKFGDNWYTWATDKRTDGSRVTDYYVCYDEPKHCDDIGWERTDSVPKCAFEIDSVLADDRACLNAFGVEPRAAPRHPGPTAAAACDGADQMKVSEIVRGCGPRLRSLWRFVRVGRRPPGATKPADVNSLLCEDEEECFLSLEYRIHRDRITFSLHEPTRGQTFKSVLRREHSHTTEEAPERPRERVRATDDTPERPRERVRAPDDTPERPREGVRAPGELPERPRERVHAPIDTPERPRERVRAPDDVPERPRERARTPDETSVHERSRADEGAEHGRARSTAGRRARTFHADHKAPEEPAGYATRRDNDVRLHDDVSDDISSEGN